MTGGRIIIVGQKRWIVIGMDTDTDELMNHTSHCNKPKDYNAE